MLVAVYYCEHHEAVVELLGNLDTSDSMEVTAHRKGYTVIYKSRNLVAVATDTDIKGCHLRAQVRME